MAGSKAEKREERRAAKNEKAQKLAGTIDNNEASSKIAVVPNDPPRPKCPVTPEARNEVLKGMPKLADKPATYSSRMTWCISVSDTEGDWSWKESRAWTEEEWTTELSRELEPLKQMTWSEIARLETGEGKKRKRRKRHHPQDVATITPEAKARWATLELEQFDTAYRFRLGGTKRAWGFQYGSHFYLVWYERHHKIYPTS